MSLDLAAFAQPLSRDQALARGILVETSAAAAFAGFTISAALSMAAWDELVCGPVTALTKAETEAASSRLRRVWAYAQRAVVAYRASGVVAPVVRFSCPGLRGRPVSCALLCRIECGRSALTLALEGEL